MRYMILIKATADSEAGKMPSEKLLATMEAFHAELARAGVLLDGNGLIPSCRGFRIEYDGPRRRVVDGPFTEAKDLLAGYTLVQVRSHDEAMEWARRFPNPAPDGGVAQIEVRPLFELDDVTARGDGEAIERMRAVQRPQA